MAYPADGTKLENLFNPQVVSAIYRQKLTDYIRFSPLARLETTLVGRPGNTLTIPTFQYIGDATDVAEGEDIPIAKLEATTSDITIKKAGRGIWLTDESVLSGYGDPVGEGVSQLAHAVANKVDNDLLAVLNAITGDMEATAAGATLVADDVADALVKFGEDIDGNKVLLVSPEAYANLRKADDWLPTSEISANTIVRGVVGMVYGTQVIVSNKLSATQNAFILKEGALGINLKRAYAIEFARNIENKSTLMTADQHYLAYLADASKAIKITAGA